MLGMGDLDDGEHGFGHPCYQKPTNLEVLGDPEGQACRISGGLAEGALAGDIHQQLGSTLGREDQVGSHIAGSCAGEDETWMTPVEPRSLGAL